MHRGGWVGLVKGPPRVHSRRPIVIRNTAKDWQDDLRPPVVILAMHSIARERRFQAAT